MSKNNLHTGIAVAAALAVVGLFFVYGNPFALVSTAEEAPPGELLVQDQVVGTGAAAALGDKVSVHYTGKLEDGTVFDTSLGRAPLVFVLGAGEVIAGWDQGLVGMQVGGKRILLIGPAFGYGEIDYGSIPGGSTLLFEVELVKIEPAQ